ncbi:kinectin-like [Ptychodera flava]|uniref:kinectin-like n=1 Tax=Ptychodera flava TaxID=63121 RepID=UPI00396A6BA8
MREIAAKVGIKLQLKATYNQERFKKVELFFINRDGGGIQPMKIHDVLAEDSAEDVQMSSNKAAETDYVEDNVADISEYDLKHEKDPSKLLLLEVDPALEMKSSTETSVQTMFKAEKCIRLKGRQCDMLQILTTNTDTVQHILSCRQDVLALLGVTRYLLTDAASRDMDTQEMELQLTRGGTKVLTLPVSDENVSLLARSLLPCQISQVQITEYIVKQLLAQISEKDSEIDLQKSVLEHQLDEAKQEKANLVEHIGKLTQTIDITEKELTKRVDKSMHEKLSSELEEKEKIISDLEAKLSGLEEIQSELKIQGQDEIKVGSQYSEDEEGTKEKKDSGGIFSKISKRIFGRKEKSDGSTAMPESKQEQSSVSTGGKEMPSGPVSSKMSGGTATTGSKQEQRSSVSTGGEEMPSGSVSSKMSGGTATTGSKQEQRSSVSTGGEEMPSGSVSSKMSGGTATTGSKQEQRRSVTTGGEEVPSGSVSSKMSGGTATTGSKSEHWSRRTLKGHQGHKFKGVRGLAFHNDKLLVCDSDNNIVHILNQDYTCEKELGSFSGQFAKPFQPQSIAVSQDNLYFILDDSNVQIVVCDQNNKVIRIITLLQTQIPGA